MLKLINTAKAPSAVGPYSQAVEINNFLYISGQIPRDALTGQILSSTIEEETKLVLKNIEEILNKANCTKNDVIKCEVFVVGVNKYFAQINKVYEEFFAGHKPTRQAVGVAELPKGVRIEISAIAFKA